MNVYIDEDTGEFIVHEKYTRYFDFDKNLYQLRILPKDTTFFFTDMDINLMRSKFGDNYTVKQFTDTYINPILHSTAHNANITSSRSTGKNIHQSVYGINANDNQDRLILQLLIRNAFGKSEIQIEGNELLTSRDYFGVEYLQTPQATGVKRRGEFEYLTFQELYKIASQYISSSNYFNLGTFSRHLVMILGDNLKPKHGTLRRLIRIGLTVESMV